MRRRSFLSRLLGETEGAAYLEAVVMMPFFIIVWGCIVYVHNYFEADRALSTRTRACMWQYASDGCGRLPVECQHLVVARAGVIDTAEIPDASSYEAFAELPFVRALTHAVIGSYWSVSSRSRVQRPPILGGATTAVHSMYALPCNAVPESPSRVAREALCRVTRLCPGTT